MLYLGLLVVVLILGFILMGIGMKEGGDPLIEGMGEALMTLAGIFLILSLFGLPIVHSNNQDKIERHREIRELVETSEENENIRIDSSLLESVKDSNKWLEDVKEANKGRFGLWIPNEVEQLKKIKL